MSCRRCDAYEAAGDAAGLRAESERHWHQAVVWFSISGGLFGFVILLNIAAAIFGWR